MCVGVCVGGGCITRLGSLRDRAVKDGVGKLWSVVVLVDDVDDDVDWILNLVTVQVHGMSSELYTNNPVQTQSLKYH